MQPSEDDSLNVYFLPPQYKSQNDLKIKDVVTHFPYLDNDSFYHFRFHAICEKDQKTWVDISNMSAKVPIVDNKILLKVLQVAKPEHTRTFAALYKPGIHQDIPSSKPFTRQNPSKAPPQTQKKPEEKSSNIRQNSPQNQQQQPVSSKSPPASNTTNAFHDFDLLGGGGEEVKVDVTVERTTKVTISSNVEGDSGDLIPEKKEKNPLHEMSREELEVHKQQQVEKAIQEKLDFAKQIYQNAENAMADRDKAYEELEDGIRKWAGKDNQRNNIRALLCTLHEVVWKESEWQALSFSDVMQPAHIKKHYWRAMKKFHPDQNQHKDYRQKYISERVTNELNAAWDEFRKTNP